MNSHYLQVLRRAAIAAVWSLSGQWATAQLDVDDLLIVDAGNDRVLQFDASAGTVSEVLSQATLSAENSSVSPALSGEVFYDSYQSYLYVSGTAGSSRLYQADMGTGTVSLASESQLLALQAVPEASVDLTGKATPQDDEILLADRGVTEGSIYRINLLNGNKSLQSTEQDYLTFSSAVGIGMTALDFTALVFDSGAGEYRLLSGGNGLDNAANTRSVLYKIDSNGQPLVEFAVSAIDADWQAMVLTSTGTTYVKQDQAGSTSIIEIDGAGTVSTLLSQANLDTIFGGPVTLAPSLTLDTGGLLYLMSLDGTVYRVDPANPLATSTLIVAAADYTTDTGTAVTNALGLAHVPAAPVSYTVTEASDPAGYVAPSSVSVIENRPYTVSNPNIVQGSFRLGFWTLNGVRQASASGRGLFQPTFNVTGDTDAVAQYYDVNLDGDGDRLNDWWEFWMFGDRSRGPQDDDDGDGFDHETEFNSGYDATVTDTAQFGGRAARQSPTITFNTSSKVLLTTRSEPLGLVPMTEVYYDLDTPITSARYEFTTNYNGHSFTHWSIDGVRVADPSGLSRREVSFLISDDTELVAHFSLTTDDTDTDGILDYLELRIADNLAQVGPGSDLDGDGFTIAQEQASGYGTNNFDTIRAGGVAARQSALVTFVVGKSLYTEDSLPLGIIPSVSEYVDLGTERTTAYYGTNLVSGLEFAYWSVNGSQVRDPSGLPLRQITNTINVNTDVRAHFFSSTLDSDDDGIVDVDERRYFGNLANDRTGDPDLDTFTIGEELDSGYSPLAVDAIRAGGVAARQSAKITFELNSNKFLLTTRSEPLGIVPETQVYYDSGTEITSTRYLYTSNYSGYRFTHWTVNGTRISDPNGVAREQTIFPLNADTELVAHFTLATDDEDNGGAGDGILDFVELRYANDLTSISPSSDLDGDGFTISDEQASGYSEVGFDTIRAGGVAARMSVVLPVNLISAPSGISLDNVTLFEGRPIGTVVGSFVTTANNPNDTFTYAFVPGVGSDDNGRFTIDGDLLVANQVFDYATDSILNIRVEVTDSRSNTYQEELLVYVLEDLLNTYEEFVAETFTPADQMDLLISGPDVDIEGDGLTNFEEYVHARNPFLADGEQLQLTFASFGTPSTVRAVELEFPWQDGMTDAEYIVERSFDLTGWTSVPFTVLNEIILNGIRQVTLQVAQLPPHPDKEFFQLRVESTATQPAVVDLSAGNEHSLFLKADGSVWATGQNGSGQLGLGSTTSQPVPVQVSALSDIVTVSAGYSHSLFLDGTGTVWGSGNNNEGQLGNTSPSSSAPVVVLTGVTDIAAGYFHSLYLDTNNIAWGSGFNLYGALGDGTTGSSLNPIQILTDVEAIAGGGYHSLFLKTNGTVWASGLNLNGELGDGTGSNQLSPVQISGLSDIVAISAGGNHSLFLESNGTLWATGLNTSGQLGDYSTTTRLSPVSVASGVVAMDAGSSHTIVLLDDGSVLTFGNNADGQLGDGTVISKSSPVLVLGGGSWFSAGGSHSLILEDDATVWATGANAQGQLGDGTSADTDILVQVPSLSTTP